MRKARGANGFPYTTNALESVHARVRTIIKTRGHFPTDEAATTLIWLARRHITADWVRPATRWKAALNQFVILYEDRFLKGPVAYDDVDGGGSGGRRRSAGRPNREDHNRFTHKASDTPAGRGPRARCPPRCLEDGRRTLRSVRTLRNP